MWARDREEADGGRSCAVRHHVGVHVDYGTLESVRSASVGSRRWMATGACVVRLRKQSRLYEHPRMRDNR